jgi:hypothetical protein
MQNGKGDSPRKKGVSEETWTRNWEQIFGKKPETNSDKKKPPK